MADLYNTLNDLELSILGSEMKELIADALDELSNGSEASSLGGTRFDDFVTMDEYKQQTPLLDVIVPASDPESRKGVKSKAIYAYVVDLKSDIDRTILKSEKPYDLSAPVLVKLKNVSDIINNIYYAIAAKTEDITESFPTNSPLSAYPSAIENMHLATEDPGYETLTVTKNGTWPEDGDDTIYSQVSVNVSGNLIANKSVTHIGTDGTLKVSTDSEVSPENKAKSGYKKIDIDISDQLKTLALTPSNILNQNGSAADLGNETAVISRPDDDETLGYKEVSIDIRDKFDSITVKIDDEFVEQTFEAKTGDGVENSTPLYGYKSVTIVIDEDSATEFEVRFHAKTVMSVTVQKHGYAAFPGTDDDIPQKEGYEFSGWNPDPVDVTKSIDVYPDYVEKNKEDTPTGSGESSETWEDISKDGGAKVKIGEWKWLYADECSYTMSFPENGGRITIKIPPMAYRVYKVASNYGGATSVWFTEQGIPGCFTWMNNTPVLGGDPDEDGQGWGNCDFRDWLNDEYFNKFGKLSGRSEYADCARLQQSILPMSRKQYGSIVNNGARVLMDTDDKLWLPSATECGIEGYSEAGNKNLGLASSCLRTPGPRSVKQVVVLKVENGKQYVTLDDWSNGPNSGWSSTVGNQDPRLTNWFHLGVFHNSYGMCNADRGLYVALPQGVPDEMNPVIQGQGFDPRRYIFSEPRFGFGT